MLGGQTEAFIFFWVFGCVPETKRETDRWRNELFEDRVRKTWERKGRGERDSEREGLRLSQRDLQTDRQLETLWNRETEKREKERERGGGRQRDSGTERIREKERLGDRQTLRQITTCTNQLVKVLLKIISKRKFVDSLCWSSLHVSKYFWLWIRILCLCQKRLTWIAFHCCCCSSSVSNASLQYCFLLSHVMNNY